MSAQTLRKKCPMFVKSTKAAGLVEYAVLAGFISIASVGTVYHFSSKTQQTFESTENTLTEKLTQNHLSENTYSNLNAGASEADSSQPIYDSTPSPALEHNEPNAAADFYFYATNIGIYDGRTRIKSFYEDLPISDKNSGTWYNFTVWSHDNIGSPTAIRHTESGQSASEGRVQYGTMLEIDIPDLGETRTVFFNVGGKVGSWTLTRDDHPPVQPFGFPDTELAWDDVHTRISSEYVDITGLTTEPLPFTVTSDDGLGNPVATHHVEGGGSADSGELKNGTILEMDIPEPGETRTLTLNVAGVEGTWKVTRENIPSTPSISLSSNNGHNFAQIKYSAIGAENIERPFTISGTGNTNPRLTNISSGTATSGMTAAWGSNISVTVPRSSSDVETITLTIDGQVITWTVTGY